MNARFAVSLVSAALAVPALAAETGPTVKGVNPAENISRLELIPKYQRNADGSDTWTFTIKYDKSLTKEIGLNFELPLVRFRGFGLDDSGLGDFQARARYVTSLGGTWNGGGGLEVVAPTAGANTLGRGKWQVNPTLFAVYAWRPNIFTAFVYKHLVSVGGDSLRPDVNENNIRVIQAYASPEGWWVTLDLKYEMDFEGGRRTLVPAVDLGRMMSESSSLALRFETSVDDRTADFVVSFSYKLFL